MKKAEAFELLDMAPNDSKPSRINPGLTRADAVMIVRAGVAHCSVPDPFDGLFEKRVWQVVHDRKRPRYERPHSMTHTDKEQGGGG